MEKFECQGKNPYDTRDQAMREIFRMIYKSFGGIGNGLRPYKCKFCHKWHFADQRVDKYSIVFLR